MKFVRKSCPYKNSLSVIHFPSHHFYYIKWPEKKFFFSRKTTTTYICMIFHEKFFQCLAGAIPLFLTPQKIGLLRLKTFPKSAFRIYISKILGVFLPLFWFFCSISSSLCACRSLSYGPIFHEFKKKLPTPPTKILSSRICRQ